MALIVLIALCVILIAAAVFAVLNGLSLGELLGEMARLLRGLFAVTGQ